jgi:hypothetical protein
MTESLITPSGVIMAAYVPDGEVRIGSHISNDPSEAEMERREKWKKEDIA